MTSFKLYYPLTSYLQIVTICLELQRGGHNWAHSSPFDRLQGKKLPWDPHVVDIQAATPISLASSVCVKLSESCLI